MMCISSIELLSRLSVSIELLEQGGNLKWKGENCFWGLWRERAFQLSLMDLLIFCATIWTPLSWFFFLFSRTVNRQFYIFRCFMADWQARIPTDQKKMNQIKTQPWKLYVHFLCVSNFHSQANKLFFRIPRNADLIRNECMNVSCITCLYLFNDSIPKMTFCLLMEQISNIFSHNSTMNKSKKS